MTQIKKVPRLIQKDANNSQEGTEPGGFPAYSSDLVNIQENARADIAGFFESDKAKVSLTIYYNGQFVLDNVRTNVKAAIETYFQNISSINFDGILNLNALNDAIQAVPGVTDTDFQNMEVRLRADQFAPGDSNNIIVNREQETFAGYVVPETNTGETLDDTLTFITG